MHATSSFYLAHRHQYCKIASTLIGSDHRGFYRSALGAWMLKVLVPPPPPSGPGVLRQGEVLHAPSAQHGVNDIALEWNADRIAMSPSSCTVCHAGEQNSRMHTRGTESSRVLRCPN
jgi:hypothetical protein